MTLIGSTSRVVAGRKAVQTVYWRTAQKQGSEESKIIKTGKTMSYDNPSPQSTAQPSEDYYFSRNSSVWQDIPSGYVPLFR